MKALWNLRNWIINDQLEREVESSHVESMMEGRGISGGKKESDGQMLFCEQAGGKLTAEIFFTSCSSDERTTW
jgi:hypothetical protein